MTQRDTTDFAFRKKLDLQFEQAVERVTEALKEEGFGVLTSIDVKATLKQKLDKDYRKYVILGACNPSLAFQALQAEPLPHNRPLGHHCAFSPRPVSGSAVHQ